MAPPSFPAEAEQAALDLLPTQAAKRGTLGQAHQPSRRIDAQFPERFVDRLSWQEVLNKRLFRPNTYLHKWWAHRCGSAFHTILKQFVPSAERADYYAAGGLEGLTVLARGDGHGTASRFAALNMASAEAIGRFFCRHRRMGRSCPR